MHSIYQFLTGTMLWVSFVVFICGTIYKTTRLLFGIYRSERFVFSIISFKYSLRSIFHWLTPFGSVNMRRHPLMTIISFVFHISLFSVPVFLTAHIILLEEAWGIHYWSIPNIYADVMTVAVIVSCCFYFFRRIKKPEVRFVTFYSDYLILLCVAAPFISGFWVYHQLPFHTYMCILHILSGEILLMTIPFTRLSHMFFALFTRSYAGSEFGGVRHARDW